jgi:hypothetical protein
MIKAPKQGLDASLIESASRWGALSPMTEWDGRSSGPLSFCYLGN